MADKNAAPAAATLKAVPVTDRRTGDEDRRKTVQAPRTPRVNINTRVATAFGVISLGAALEWDWTR